MCRCCSVAAAALILRTDRTAVWETLPMGFYWGSSQEWCPRCPRPYAAAKVEYLLLAAHDVAIRAAGARMLRAGRLSRRRR